jgi:hypothetical protein
MRSAYTPAGGVNMKDANARKLGLGVTVLVALVAVGVGPRLLTRHQAVAAPANAKGIAPDADRLLHQMTDYLAGLKTVTVHTSASDEVVLKSGQKLQLMSESVVTVQRPNMLRSEQVGAKGGLAFFYDGKTMTLECKDSGVYTTVAAPPTLDATIDKAREEFQIEAPGADLLYSKPYDILTEQVKGGQLVGREVIDGMPVHHLAFQGDEVDWQVWIKDGPEPLPLRYSITTKTMPSQPEFSVRLSQWDTRASILPTAFQFQAPTGATRAQTFPKTCGAGTSH